jgi:AsmA protein
VKKLFAALGILVVLVIVALVAIPFLVPVETYKGQLIARVKEATGRDLRIDGPMKLSLFPRVAVEANDVSFANAPGAASKDMVKLSQLAVALKVLPLLHGAVEVDKFVLTDPLIALEIDKQGRPNWVFAKAGDKPAAPAARQQGAPAAPEAKGRNAALAELRLDDVRLVNGRVTYLDQRSGTKEEVGDINMKVALPGLDSPFTADGSAVWHAEKVSLTANLASLRAFEEGKPTNLALKVASRPLNFEFTGQGAGTSPPKLGGTIDLQVPSVRELAGWTGHPITMAGTGLGPLAIKGKLDLAGAKVTFSNADLALDAIKAKGELALDASGAKPHAKGRLDVDKLDVNPYLPPEAPAGANAGAAASPAGSAGRPAAAGGKPAGWSTDPIDTSALKAADADFDLSVGGIVYRKIQIGKGALALHLKDGHFVADLSELALYQGSVQGKLALDGSGVPALDVNVKLANIQAEPLLRDAVDFDRLTGAGNFDMAVTGHGRSQREIVEALNGRGSLAFLNGAIRGIDLGAMARNVSNAFLNDGRPQQTDFSELSGTYTITNGILRNPDLALKAPLFRLDGAGTVDLPNRTLDYRLMPKLAATAEGQGGKDAPGIMVPIVVRGPWDHLSYQPDLSGVLQDAAKDPAKLLQGLKGAVPGGGSGNAPKPSDVLKGLLGR